MRCEIIPLLSEKYLNCCLDMGSISSLISISIVYWYNLVMFVSENWRDDPYMKSQPLLMFVLLAHNTCCSVI